MKTSKRIDKKDVKEVFVDGMVVKILGHNNEVLDEVKDDNNFAVEIHRSYILDQLKDDTLDYVDFDSFDCGE